MWSIKYKMWISYNQGNVLIENFNMSSNLGGKQVLKGITCYKIVCLRRQRNEKNNNIADCFDDD